jgi:RNA polymerase sigma factor (sigma-70 family)
MSPIQLNDQSLVSLYYSGNNQALEILITRHKAAVFGHIIQLTRQHALSEDIYQDTVLKVITHIKTRQYQEEGKFLPWMIRIAHNLVIDYFRRKKRLPIATSYYNAEGDEQSPLDQLKSDSTEFSTVEYAPFKKYIRQRIHKLPPEQREVVIMRVQHDMSFKEIAERTQVSINTALGRMRYAILNLKKQSEVFA